MMAEEDSQYVSQPTQMVMDPRRLGRQNSGLSDEDVADVICILHPASPAAYRIVASTAKFNPQHILQQQLLLLKEDHAGGTDDLPDSQLNTESQGREEESQTFLTDDILKSMDIALRFSSRVFNPVTGFCFGRSTNKCDINLDPDGVQKRVSHTHFRIYYNQGGVLMLEDVSTNGTAVDGILLCSKKEGVHSTRMLETGAIIEIVSTGIEDVIKFIVRIPKRTGYLPQHTEKFQQHMAHVEVAGAREQAAHEGHIPEAAARALLAAPFAGPANTKAFPMTGGSGRFGMRWDGGGKYSVVGVLGKGAFAIVYQIATLFSGEYYAAKELEKRRFMRVGQLENKLENEMAIMKALQHPSIVQYIEYVETKDHLYIIMEFIPGGDLTGYLQAHGSLPEDMARTMTCQILEALAYLHTKNITHRDIKPDNILICSLNPFVTKLTDFGLSKVVKNNETFMKTFCGTMLYCAPEVFPQYEPHLLAKGTKRRRQSPGPRSHHYNQAIDVWSFAVVLWTVLCGKPPFAGVSDISGKGMFDQIMNTTLDVSPLRDHHVSDAAIDLLINMLDTDPMSRPSELECLKHPWLGGGGSQMMVSEGQSGAGVGLSSIEEQDESSKSQLGGRDQESPDMPQSKRPRADNLSSSVEGSTFDPVAYDTIPIVNDVRRGTQQERQPRLFGEVSQRYLQSSGTLGNPAAKLGSYQNQSEAQASVGSSGYISEDEELMRVEDEEKGEEKLLGASLLGAESLVRDLHMTSPESTKSSHIFSSKCSPKCSPIPSRKADIRPNTPQTPTRSRNSFCLPTYSRTSEKSPKAQVTPRGPSVQNRQSDEEDASQITPRALIVLDRQINLPLMGTRSAAGEGCLTDLKDDHEGFDDLNGFPFAVDTRQQTAIQTSLPSTEAPSDPSTTASESYERPQDVSHAATNGATDRMTARTLINTNTNGFKKPAPPLGRLETTPESWQHISLHLSEQNSSWGRLQSCTFVYPFPLDIRVPKKAIQIYFHATGIETAQPSTSAEPEADDKQWAESPDTQVFITTRAKKGVKVNGVQLEQCNAARQILCGRLHTGDVIEVASDSAGGVLRFVSEFFVGQGRTRRSRTFEAEVSTMTL